MKKNKNLYNQIKEIANSQEYLELGYIKHLELIYLLQNLEYEEWEKLSDFIQKMPQKEQQVIADSIIEIKGNKKSNYDTSSIYAYIFTISDDLIAECMLENFDFIDNEVPKKVDLIDGLMDRLKNLDGKTKISKDLSVEYALVNKLYNNAIC